MKHLRTSMAPHSGTVAWRIPWMEEPGRLQSMGSLGVRHDWVTSLSLSTFMHWRRKWQPTSVFLPGESHGRRSLVGCSPWGRTESDTTEATWQAVTSNTTLVCSITQKNGNYNVQKVHAIKCVCTRKPLRALSKKKNITSFIMNTHIFLSFIRWVVWGS